MRACTRACMQTWCGDSKVHADGIYAFIYNLQYLTGMHAKRGRQAKFSDIRICTGLKSRK